MNAFDRQKESTSPAELRLEAAVCRAEIISAFQPLLHLYTHLGEYAQVEHLARIAKELEIGPPASPTNWQEVFWKLGQVAMKLVPAGSFSSAAKLAGGYSVLIGVVLSQLEPATLAELNAASDDTIEDEIRKIVPNLPEDAVEELIQAIRGAAADSSLPGNSVPPVRDK